MEKMLVEVLVILEVAVKHTSISSTRSATAVSPGVVVIPPITTIQAGIRRQ